MSVDDGGLNLNGGLPDMLVEVAETMILLRFLEYEEASRVKPYPLLIQHYPANHKGLFDRIQDKASGSTPHNGRHCSTKNSPNIWDTPSCEVK